MIPRRYRKSPDFVATFDFQDVAAGIGYNTYYAFAMVQDGTTRSYFLSPQKDFYTDHNQSGGSTSNSSVSTVTLDFDSSTFNLQRTAKGSAIVYFTVRNPEADITNCQFKAQIKKVASDGTTVTTLSSEFTKLFDGTAGTGAIPANTSYNVLFMMPLTETIIAQGEKIRLTIKLIELDATDNIIVYHDPAGRDFDTIGANFSTAMKLIMPFKLQI